MLITDADAFEALTAIEGAAWAKRERYNAAEPNTFFDAQAGFQILLDQGLVGKLTKDPETGRMREILIGDVTGSDGFSGAGDEVYVVLSRGQVALFADTASQAKVKKARKIMMVLGDTKASKKANKEAKALQDAELFEVEVTRGVLAMGGKDVGGMYRLLIETPVGPLKVDPNGKTSTVFCRFEHPKQAADALRGDAINPYSGKWNHHLRGGGSPIDLANAFLESLRSVMSRGTKAICGDTAFGAWPELGPAPEPRIMNVTLDEEKSYEHAEELHGPFEYAMGNGETFVARWLPAAVADELIRRATVLGVLVATEDLSADYVFLKTTAPESYDGFSTQTIGVDGDSRIVALRRKDLDWQQNRYHSGFFPYEPYVAPQSSSTSALPAGMEGFGFFDPGPAKPQIGDEVRAELGGELESMLDATVLLKGSVLDQLEQPPAVYHFRKHQAWMLKTPDKTTAGKVAKRAHRSLVGKRSLTSEDPFLHHRPLYVAYPGGFIRVVPEPAKKRDTNKSDQKYRILSRAKLIFGANGAKLGGHDGAYKLSFTPALKRHRGVFSQFSVSAPTLDELAQKLEEASAKLAVLERQAAAKKLESKS